MRVVDPGHRYEVDELDGGQPGRIVFVKRIGEGYPGNTGEPHAGTNCQELLRVLIDRVKYLDSQIRSPWNAIILKCLRIALDCFEQRAADRHGRLMNWSPHGIEQLSTCQKCGHIGCHGECHGRQPQG